MEITVYTLSSIDEHIYGNVLGNASFFIVRLHHFFLVWYDVLLNRSLSFVCPSLGSLSIGSWYFLVLMIPPSLLSTDASFRSHAVNLVAVVPLLSSSADKNNKTEHHSHSEDSFHSLWQSLLSHEFSTTTTTKISDNNNKADAAQHLILTVPNSTLTRPGDWRYNNTPLKAFHWSHGCQRLNIFDGRINNRYSHDKLLKGQNHWSDLQTERRIAAVIGVLNMHDCPTPHEFAKALHELQNWAQRYSTPKYATFAHGKSLPRDTPIIRLFVYDSFDEASPRIDLNQNPTIHSTNILAFPPTDQSHAAMMDLHLNVVISDLTVGIFRDLETKITQLENNQHHNPNSSNGGSSTTTAVGPNPSTTTASVKSKISRLVSGGSTSGSGGGGQDAGVMDTAEEFTSTTLTSTKTVPTAVTQKKNTSSASLGLSNLADLVASDNLKTSYNARKAGDHKNESNVSMSTSATAASSSSSESQSLAELLTPLDDDMPPWDVANFHKRQMGRFIKLAADWCLLAGSPLDAYERYLRAAEFSKLTDAVWYAASLQGCAAAHVAMAEAGGYSVDEYLDVNFQLPEEIMNLAKDADANATTAANKRQQQNKQTLPEVVIALSEEAIGIYRQQEQLAGLHSELLLKLALYVAEQEGHWRCRWGEGTTCYAGEPSDVPRYQRSSVAKMQFQYPLKNLNGDDIISLHDLMRVRKVSEWLATAVSIGPLDPPTRVDVATRAAKLCLHGIEPTKWSSGSGKNDSGSTIHNRMQLSRKAAFFTVVAAEALSVAVAMTAQNAASTDTAVASDLWFLATQLFSPSPNDASMMDGSYGWATLRAYCWDCLSKYGGSGELALEAAGKLMSLLSELDPEIPLVEAPSTSNPKRSAPMDERSRISSSAMSAMDGDDDGDTASERRSSLGPFVDDENLQEKISSATTQLAKTLQSRYSNFTSSSASLTPGAAIPHHPFNQTKKLELEDDAFPSTVEVPLSESSSSISESVVNLRLVWPQMDYNVCFEAQKHCLERTIILRRAIPVSSSLYVEEATGSGPATYDRFHQSLPLFVSSAAAIQSGSKLELECVVKKRAAPDESKEGAMATFFNPYESKRSDNNKTAPIRVAEEEEHAMLIRFGNRLSLPLEVQQGQLVFEDNGKMKAASLSFVIPAKAKSYSVNFPFTVLSKDTQSSDEETVAVKGLELTCFGRTFFVPIKELRICRANAHAVAVPYNFPTPASFYPLRLHKQKDSTTSSESIDVVTPRIAAFPCQPRLQMFFADTGTPAEMLTVSLSDGEIFTVPTLKLRNYMGPSSKGKIQFLEIIAIGLPGVPSKKIYESKNGPTVDDSEADFVHDLIFEASPPVLKIRTLKCSLHLDSVNTSSKSSDDDRANVTFQIAAAHNMCEKMIEGTSVVIQVRYRGLCSEQTEVWRKLEFSLRIVPSKGPRISSIAFRPDLSKGSALAELTSMFDSKKKSRVEKKTPSKTESISSLILQRTGLDSEMSVCGDNTYFVLTVANETRSVITLKKEDGAVGGFLEFPLAEISCRPGVSAKIPIVMPRIARVDENGNVNDVLSELITTTRLIWESHKGGETGPVRGRGHIRIPPACLADIVNRQPSLIAHVAKPPCAMHFFVKAEQTTALRVSADVIITSAVGKPIEVALRLEIASWVPAHVRNITNVSIEFCCARKCVDVEDDKNQVAVHRDIIWAGLLRQRFSLRDRNAELAHRTKLVFCRSGTYVVSACAKFSRLQQNNDEDIPEEVWWAPVAQAIDIPEMHHPA
jgi:hypothetical protein